MRLVAAAAFLASLACGFSAAAQGKFPERPIRIISPFGAGGLADITMRLVGQKLMERTGQGVVIENRPSAGGILAAGAVTAAAPDGYTLFVLSSGLAISKSVVKAMPFDPVTAFAPISTVAYFDLLLVAKGDSPLRNVADMLGAARSDPAKFNIGAISPGSTQNVTGHFVRSATGVGMTIVPFRGTPEVTTALMRGEVTIGVETYAALKGQIDHGELRAIGSTGDVRSQALPDVPTLRESGIAVEVMGWNALVAPAGTPPAIIDTLNAHVRAIVESEDFKKRMSDLGTQARASTPAELGARLAGDVAMWADVVKRAGIEPM